MRYLKQELELELEKLIMIEDTEWAYIENCFKVKSYHIASYLGIAPQTLSKLRKNESK